MAGVGRKKIYKRLRNKFRLVILNDDTFEEKFSMVLSPFNLFTWGGLAVILTAAIVFALIAFTPLSEMIPGYGDETTKKLAIATTLKADSIEQKLKPTEAYLTNIASILKGKVNDSVEEIEQDSATDYSEINLDPSKEDSLFRLEMEAKTEYNLMFKNKGGVADAGSYFFFTPLNGPVTSEFNPASGHYGVDITAPSNETVMATLDGVVVIATWTSETGNVIVIQHRDGILSIYKHNATLLKKAGDRVKAGEPIAIIGESGELTSGPHLHFELWLQGRPVDPGKHIEFKTI